MGDIGHNVTPIHDVSDGFNFEFLCISLVAIFTSLISIFVWLSGVWSPKQSKLLCLIYKPEAGYCMRFFIGFGIFLFLALASVTDVRAEPFLEGGKAYDAGDSTRALEIWKPLAEAGDPRAQYAIANLYFEGLGVSKNEATANYWMERAAQQGLAAAQLTLGNNYREGFGLPRNDAKAVEWWQLAAEQGNTDAMYNLGVHYYYGRGVARDNVTALEWFLKAADGGHEQARNAIRVENKNAALPADGSGIHSVQWIMQQDPENYTIQLAAMSDREGVDRYIRMHGIEGEIGVFPRKTSAKTILVIILGVFPDSDTARQALDQLPASAKKQLIWARPFAEIQAIIEAKN